MSVRMRERADEMESNIAEFWSRFLASPAAARLRAPVFYDVMRIGSSEASANHGARLILSGRKTATSSPPGDYPSPEAWPYEGALSVLLDGSSDPVAVIETTQVVLRRLGTLDDAFARAYGEWDGTARRLRDELAAHYGCGAGQDLICETFRVIFRQDG